MVLQLLRRAVLSVGIAGLIASTLRAIGLGTSTEFETGGWRDARDDELLSTPLSNDTNDLSRRARESV